MRPAAGRVDDNRIDRAPARACVQLRDEIAGEVARIALAAKMMCQRAAAAWKFDDVAIQAPKQTQRRRICGGAEHALDAAGHQRDTRALRTRCRCRRGLRIRIADP
jgi:hypothetical protein